MISKTNIFELIILMVFDLGVKSWLKKYTAGSTTIKAKNSGRVERVETNKQTNVKELSRRHMETATRRNKTM